MMYLVDLILVFIWWLLLIVSLLIGVAFLTLLERKVLGYIQIRKGPNKAGILGIPQPFSDAIKLFTKEQIVPFMSNFNLYYISPVFNLYLSLFLWVCVPFMTGLLSFNLGVLFFLSISSLGVYSVMISGWASNSNYSMLGSMRAVAQTISYEVSLALIFMSFLFLISSLNLMMFNWYQSVIWFIFFCLPLCLVWVSSSLAETNRTPFDFAEGESELVSGFNVEYSGGGFALIFLAEYSSILFMSLLCVILFMGCKLNSLFFFMLLGLISFFWVWVRGTLPRFRYDKLMYLAWKSFLPVSLNYLIMYFGVKFLLFSVILYF